MAAVRLQAKESPGDFPELQNLSFKEFGGKLGEMWRALVTAEKQVAPLFS
jgi:hypothetical protein